MKIHTTHPFNLSRLALSLSLLLLFAACGSRKKALEAGVAGGDAVEHAARAMERVVQQVNDHRVTVENVTARLSLALEAGGKSVNVGGHLRMKRDDVIQVSLVALGLLEVGRMEITPDYFMVVDRVGQQYVKASFDDIDFMRRNGIDFYTFQSLFWDELFILGDKGEAPTSKHFQKSMEGEDVKLVNRDGGQVVLTFLADVTNGLVRRTSFSGRNEDSPALDWQYLDYGEVSRQSFPMRMQVQLNSASKPVKAMFNLSNIKTDSKWETRTTPNKKFTQVSPETVFKRIMNMAK